jgi:ABC-type polysaccharide/polyol phosphate transport system ATPase subunit
MDDPVSAHKAPGPAILVEEVWKRFRLYKYRSIPLKTLLLQFGRNPYEEIWALRDVSFSVTSGETVAVIGRNGSGKSTLLGLLGRVYRADRGSVAVNGRSATLLELGAGFHAELSGRENVYLNGSILGLSRRTIEGVYDDIVRFAELERFIDAPQKNYSAGMTMRLGFSIAIHAEPDVLLVDEVLAVGDEAFQLKCYAKIAEFQRADKTILFVSHDLTAVRRVAPRTIWLHEGELRMDGETESVLAEYTRWAHATTGV